MEETFIPDYSTYETDLLVDVYTRIDRENNPLKAKALDDEIKKRFNLPPGTEIDATVVKSFLNTINQKNIKVKSELSKTEDMIKHGWISGVIVGSISLLFWFITMFSKGAAVQGTTMSIYGIIDILGIFGLSYGVSRKSRVCAATLAGYYILIKLIQMYTLGFLYSIISSTGLIVFSTFFIRAAYGVFKYHSITLTNELQSQAGGDPGTPAY